MIFEGYNGCCSADSLCFFNGFTNYNLVPGMDAIEKAKRNS